MKRRALAFAPEEDFDRALGLLFELAETGPLEYDTVPGDDEDARPAVVLPEWSYQRLLPLLRKRRLSFEELDVTSISDLSPDDQARARGLK